MVLIHEKITALLEQRRLKKRDLARALGVSPQTATDICKGRSAITLPHLRNLIRFFEIRSEFWLDDERVAPEEVDQVARRPAADALTRAGLLDLEDPEHFVLRMRAFVQQNREAFLAAVPDVSVTERQLLGLAPLLDGRSAEAAAPASAKTQPAATGDAQRQTSAPAVAAPVKPTAPAETAAQTEAAAPAKTAGDSALGDSALGDSPLGAGEKTAES
ncbi:MAG: transcriptional regulator [Planctomycetota bacterium]